MKLSGQAGKVKLSRVVHVDNKNYFINDLEDLKTPVASCNFGTGDETNKISKGNQGESIERTKQKA